jgi:D-aminopeptidase
MVILLSTVILTAGVSCSSSACRGAARERPRARELGLRVGEFETGRWNAITDVGGVLVGHTTTVEGAGVRTGVTAILPHDGDVFQEKVRAAIAVGNGFGKLVGVTQVRELGLIETPIVLTNTLSTFTAATALIRRALTASGNEDVRSVNPVVGECNDGWLNDIRGFHVTERHVLGAIDGASSGPVAEGSVGAGTGTRCLGFKGGIGTSSRLVAMDGATYTLGVLVQTNYGGTLTMSGVPVGRILRERRESNRDGGAGGGGDAGGPGDAEGDRDAGGRGGSCMVVAATDAPLSSRELERLARRAFLGLARTGSIMSHGSGDYCVAFSTAYRISNRQKSPAARIELLRDDRMTPLFAALVDATEEAVYNSLLKAETVTGIDGHEAEALPIGEVESILREWGVLEN